MGCLRVVVFLMFVEACKSFLKWPWLTPWVYVVLKILHDLVFVKKSLQITAVVIHINSNKPSICNWLLYCDNFIFSQNCITFCYYSSLKCVQSIFQPGYILEMCLLLSQFSALTYVSLCANKKEECTC